MRLFEILATEFSDGIEIIEHYGDYYRLKLQRQENQSIGRLFGVIQECKEKHQIVTEYSVS